MSSFSKPSTTIHVILKVLCLDPFSLRISAYLSDLLDQQDKDEGTPLKAEVLAIPAHPSIKRNLNINIVFTSVAPLKVKLSVVVDDHLPFSDHAVQSPRHVGLHSTTYIK